MDRPPPTPTPPPATQCPDCSGAGRITLLVSIRPCPTCAGSGVLSPALDRLMADFELSIRTRKLLQRIGVRTVRDLLSWDAAALVRDHRFSTQTVDELATALRPLGLKLRNVT